MSSSQQSVSTPSLQKTVLVVDDSPMFLDMISKVIGKSGYKVIKAKDGIEALEILRTQNPIHLVWTDIDMPELDGVELARIVRQLYPDIRIVFNSSDLAHCGYRIEDLTGFSPHFLKKPSGVEQIQALAKVILGA